MTANGVPISFHIKEMHNNEESTYHEVDAAIEKKYRKVELDTIYDVKLTVEFPQETGEEAQEIVKSLKETMEFLTFEKVKNLKNEEAKNEEVKNE